MNRIFPECIKKIGIAATSKLPGDLTPAITMLRQQGIAVLCAENTMTPGDEDYFASDAETRTADFNSLLEDESIDLILAARGGYGSAYLAEGINWDLLRIRNLPVLGYSDVTALHMAMLANHAGIPVACGMAQQLTAVQQDEYSRNAMLRAVSRAMGISLAPEEHPLIPVTNSVQNNVTGGLIPANLAVLTSLCGTELIPDFHGRILLLEDIDEEPRKIDRMMLQLDLCGILKQTSGIIFGDFTGECGTAEERNRIFRRFAERNPETPFWKGIRFGHALPSLSFAADQKITIRKDNIAVI